MKYIQTNIDNIVKKYENIPTFNVVIATIGRPNILNMLKSLEKQLEKEDCLTIIYDKCKPIKAIYSLNIKCKIIIIESGIGEPHKYVCGGGNLIRDNYKNQIEKRDFILHGDDDDEYLPDTFSKLRNICKNKDCLYIFKFRYNNDSNWVVPSDLKNICQPCNLGTPNGIIPYELNKIGKWGCHQLGDYDFYNSIWKKAKHIIFKDIIIYNVPSNKHVDIEELIFNEDDCLLKYNFYINLKNRIEKKNDTIKLLKMMGCKNPQRFPAIVKDNKSIGCSLSHLECLKLAKIRKYPYVLIFEDDIDISTWILNKYGSKHKEDNFKSLSEKISDMLKIDFDVLFLGGNNRKPFHNIDKENERYIKVENCYTYTSYIVKEHYYDKLIKYNEEAIEKNINIDLYNIDLQKKDNWILITPPLFVQKPTFSDIYGHNTPNDWSDQFNYWIK